MENLSKNDQLKYDTGAIQAMKIQDLLNTIIKRGNSIGKYSTTSEFTLMNKDTIAELEKLGVIFDGFNDNTIPSIKKSIKELNSYAEAGRKLKNKREREDQILKGQQELIEALGEHGIDMKMHAESLDNHTIATTEHSQKLEENTNQLRYG